MYLLINEQNRNIMTHLVFFINFTPLLMIIFDEYIILERYFICNTFLHEEITTHSCGLIVLRRSSFWVRVSTAKTETEISLYQPEQVQVPTMETWPKEVIILT
jgi:hypothetical protein